MTDATELDEAAIRARVEAATPGPWQWEGDSCSDDGLTYNPSRVWTDGGVDYFGEANDDYVLATHLGNADAEFIAHARTDLPAALDEVTRLRAALDEYGDLAVRCARERDEQRKRAEAAESALAALRALADEWTAVYERWNGVSDGPRVAIFNVHARKILALLAEHEPTPSDKAREGHIVHVTVEPVAEDVVWCEECEEWVSSGAPEGAPATPSDQALRDLRAGVEARDRIARVLYEEHFDREDDDWLSTADGSPNSASYALADRILASSAPATASAVESTVQSEECTSPARPESTASHMRGQRNHSPREGSRDDQGDGVGPTPLPATASEWDRKVREQWQDTADRWDPETLTLRPATASEGVASCPHDELMSDPCAECYFDANADDGLPATGVTSSDGDQGLSEALAEKWTSASIAARKAEHHFPADCLAEAVRVVRHLTEQLDALAARTAQVEGTGDDSDVEAGRCCPSCRVLLTDHNRAVWNAGYAIGQRHERESPDARSSHPEAPGENTAPAVLTEEGDRG